MAFDRRQFLEDPLGNCDDMWSEEDESPIGSNVEMRDWATWSDWQDWSDRNGKDGKIGVAGIPHIETVGKMNRDQDSGRVAHTINDICRRLETCNGRACLAGGVPVCLALGWPAISRGLAWHTLACRIFGNLETTVHQIHTYS